MSSSELKKIVEELFEDSKKTPERGLKAIAEAEKYLQQAYDGRYFFELIQNVRDANKEINQDGEIFIKLDDRMLTIANTGAEFSKEGFEGITTIGQSTKQSQDYIGFKGIGFKSIQEITEEPKIITKFGSIYFDRKLTLQQYYNSNLKEEQIPLFYFPHYNDKELSKSEIQTEIVTKIELPIKENITEEKVVVDFRKIEAKQLVLLGNIKGLHFDTKNNNIDFIINKDVENKLIEVKENDKPSVKYRYFIPDNKVEIPEEKIKSLEGKEKDIFSKSPYVDISIVLELGDKEQIKPIENAKLYLFYPLLINSGFKFIIHSYFIVNPERTALRNNPLNDFLLQTIGRFIGREVLRYLKRAKANTNQILCFRRISDVNIGLLYDSLVEELENQRFVFDSQSHKYFLPSDIVVADGFTKGLFPDGKFNNMQLIYIDDKEIINWLTSEFEIHYLSSEDIANQIEDECKRQRKAKKIIFFQNLYNYVSQHHELNLTSKKVLLTENWKLVSSEADVFYGGGKKNSISLPASRKERRPLRGRKAKPSLSNCVFGQYFLKTNPSLLTTRQPL